MPSTEVVVHKHAAQTTTKQSSKPTNNGIITVSKRELITSKQKPASAIIAANIQEVVVVTM